MNHLTNLYKHKCEQLQEQIYRLTRMLNEADASGPGEFQVPNQPQDAPFQVAPLPGEPGHAWPTQKPYYQVPKPEGEKPPVKPNRKDYSSDATYTSALAAYEMAMVLWRLRQQLPQAPFDAPSWPYSPSGWGNGTPSGLGFNF